MCRSANQQREVAVALAKMRRVFLVGPSDLKEKTMAFLQERGVVHIEPVVKLTGEMEKKYAAIQQQVRRVGQICEEMTRFEKLRDKAHSRVSDDELLPFCESRLLDLQGLQSRKETLRKLIQELQVWGDFDPQGLHDLEKEGVFVQRFRVEGKLPEDFTLPEETYTEVISERPVLNFFTVHIGSPVQIPQAIQLRHPEIGLKRAQEEFHELQEKEVGIIQQCTGVSDRIEAMREFYNSALNEASYTENLGTLYSEGYIFGLQGWIPEDTESGLLKEIESSRLPLMATTREPLEDETPPTLFKNNWFIRQIEPLLKLYGLPAYRSIDPSYFFAPFMILFFGICMGDAGYGLVFLLLSTWFKKKWQRRGEGFILAMKLCQAFSISTIVIGVITGSIFGYSFTNRGWILVDLDIDKGDPMILFYASLGLGVLHLSCSYLIGMLDARSRDELMQKLGLMLVLWGGVMLISRNIWFSDPASGLNTPFNYVGWVLLALGVALTFFFASDSKRLVVRIGLGFWNIYGLTGLIGDLLSYARLFGLGIATTAIAAVMNQLAGMIRDAAGPILGTVFAVLLLVMGHSFNFAISILGSTVHSARLHFVEAFRSFFQGGGVQYKPFKIERG
jgi:V/A-type H+/Na+-transporting ATPase subunit I